MFDAHSSSMSQGNFCRAPYTAPFALLASVGSSSSENSSSAASEVGDACWIRTSSIAAISARLVERLAPARKGGAFD
jgi:hypothetical protein